MPTYTKYSCLVSAINPNEASSEPEFWAPQTCADENLAVVHQPGARVVYGETYGENQPRAIEQRVHETFLDLS